MTLLDTIKKTIKNTKKAAFRIPFFGRQTLPLAFSFLLPPQTQNHEWVWKNDLKKLKVRKARRIDKLSDRVFLHRWTKVSRDKSRLIWPDPDTGVWMNVNAWTGADPRGNTSWKLKDLKTKESLDSIRIFPLGFPADLPLGMFFGIISGKRY